MPGNQSTFPPAGRWSRREICVPESLHQKSMAATDLVPCYYTGQNYRVEKPAEKHPRHQVREFKRQKLGEFIENGKLFLFFKRVSAKAKQLWDGPFGIGNLLPFFKAQNPLMAPEKLHYQVPQAGDAGVCARHRRHLIQVSVRRGKRILEAASRVPAGVLSVPQALLASPNSAQ